MAISYNGLWKLMIDKKLQKKNLIEDLNISSATIAKMGKGESVSVDVLERICGYMDCNIGDIMSFEKEETKEAAEKR
jgi:DNA-binding Xre family transcriptional regulator